MFFAKIKVLPIQQLVSLSYFFLQDNSYFYITEMGSYQRKSSSTLTERILWKWSNEGELLWHRQQAVTKQMNTGTSKHSHTNHHCQSLEVINFQIAPAFCSTLSHYFTVTCKENSSNDHLISSQHSNPYKQTRRKANPASWCFLTWCLMLPAAKV